MRELTLIETSYLCGGLLLCLVLPLMMSFRGSLDAPTKRSCMETVWTGQALLSFVGLTILASAQFAPYAAVLGLVSCMGCALVLQRQFRVALPTMQ